MPTSGTLISTPPKELMASTTKVLPAAFTTEPTAAMSLRMPVVVSLCTMATMVTSGLAAKNSSTFLASGILSQAKSNRLKWIR